MKYHWQCYTLLIVKHETLKLCEWFWRCVRLLQVTYSSHNAGPITAIICDYADSTLSNCHASNTTAYSFPAISFISKYCVITYIAQTNVIVYQILLPLLWKRNANCKCSVTCVAGYTTVTVQYVHVLVRYYKNVEIWSKCWHITGREFLKLKMWPSY